MANSINSTYCNANVCVFVVVNVVVVYTGIEGKKKDYHCPLRSFDRNLEQNKLLLQVSAFIMVSTRAPMQL